MNDAEIKRIYKAARRDDADLLLSDAEARQNAIDALEDAFGGDGRISLRQSEIKQLYQAAKRNPAELLPSDEADYQSGLETLKDAYEN